MALPSNIGKGTVQGHIIDSQGRAHRPDRRRTEGMTRG